MTHLTVTNVEDQIVVELERRAAEHGVTAEDEHRRILSEALARRFGKLPFKEFLLAMPDVGEDWMFDRHDPRNAKPQHRPLMFED